MRKYESGTSVLMELALTAVVSPEDTDLSVVAPALGDVKLASLSVSCGKQLSSYVITYGKPVSAVSRTEADQEFVRKDSMSDVSADILSTLQIHSGGSLLPSDYAALSDVADYRSGGSEFYWSIMNTAMSVGCERQDPAVREFDEYITNSITDAKVTILNPNDGLKKMADICCMTVADYANKNDFADTSAMLERISAVFESPEYEYSRMKAFLLKFERDTFNNMVDRLAYHNLCSDVEVSSVPLTPEENAMIDHYLSSKA